MAKGLGRPREPITDELRNREGHQQNGVDIKAAYPTLFHYHGSSPIFARHIRSLSSERGKVHPQVVPVALKERGIQTLEPEKLSARVVCICKGTTNANVRGDLVQLV